MAQQKSQINDRERLYRLRHRDVAVTSATVPSFERKVSADKKNGCVNNDARSKRPRMLTAAPHIAAPKCPGHQAAVAAKEKQRQEPMPRRPRSPPKQRRAIELGGWGRASKKRQRRELELQYIWAPRRATSARVHKLQRR